MKIHKGDTVKVLIGKESGKTGRVERLYVEQNMVLVEGMNSFKRHMKSRVQNQKSEIIDINKPLAAANVAIVCPKCKKTTRVGFKMENGKKVRICRKCKKNID
jgi:large subunit ribosomal protein L24